MQQVRIFSATDHELEDATAQVESGVNQWLETLNDPKNQTKPVQIISMQPTHTVADGLHYYTLTIQYV